MILVNDVPSIDNLPRNVMHSAVILTGESKDRGQSGHVPIQSVIGIPPPTRRQRIFDGNWAIYSTVGSANTKYIFIFSFTVLLVFCKNVRGW